ncbi:hypothetical protein [Bosea sp. PAMC 26642]|uniref:hypothetical protein n=1 Tax=Bosea sp. (strain PAMC 26642) TaxID=1792307 RepID=UPI0012E8BD31|nr:hypothetical protein [Bosea sp. PAMC 26642]
MNAVLMPDLRHRQAGRIDLVEHCRDLETKQEQEAYDASHGAESDGLQDVEAEVAPELDMLLQGTYPSGYHAAPSEYRRPKD